jgi:hypothetical protein
LLVKAETQHTASLGDLPGIAMEHYHIQSPAEPEDFDYSTSPPLPAGPPSEYRVSPLPLASPPRNPL